MWDALKFNDWLFPKKDRFDEKLIASAFKKIVESKTQDTPIHIFAVGSYYFWNKNQLSLLILREMMKYKIPKVMLTVIFLRRWDFIRKDEIKNYYKGKEKAKLSINDDLAKVFETIQLGKKPDYEVDTYFLPQLTEKEIDLVVRCDKNFINTFYRYGELDDKMETEASEFDLEYQKYVRAFGGRKTFQISLPEKSCCFLQ